MEDAPFHNDLAHAPEGGKVVWLESAGARIRAGLWRGDGDATILIFNGRTEYIEKYGHVITRLVGEGYTVATLDWRGQGLSDRLLPEVIKGHVEDFADYQSDVQALLDFMAEEGAPPIKAMICHSMGGCIGMRTLVDGRVKPEVAVFSAPMLGIEMPFLQRLGAVVVVFFARLLGLMDASAPAPHAKESYVSWEKFERNTLTGDREYWNWMVANLEAEPKFGLGAPTLRWLERAGGEMSALSAAPAPSLPITLLLGSHESIVSPKAIREFAARAPNAHVVDVPGGQHEGFMETPDRQKIVWEAVEAALAKIR
ncbi:MAG: alpha/beta hydrolase [Pseudomonadota bacterium]